MSPSRPRFCQSLLCIPWWRPHCGDMRRIKRCQSASDAVSAIRRGKKGDSVEHETGEQETGDIRAAWSARKTGHSALSAIRRLDYGRRGDPSADVPTHERTWRHAEWPKSFLNSLDRHQPCPILVPACARVSTPAAAIQHPSQFEAFSVKNTIVMAARLGGLGVLECALTGQTVPEIRAGRFSPKNRKKRRPNERCSPGVFARKLSTVGRSSSRHADPSP
jgi:hypothetical protein